MAVQSKHMHWPFNFHTPRCSAVCTTWQAFNQSELSTAGHSVRAPGMMTLPGCRLVGPMILQRCATGHRVHATQCGRAEPLAEGSANIRGTMQTTASQWPLAHCSHFALLSYRQNQVPLRVLFEVQLAELGCLILSCLFESDVIATKLERRSDFHTTCSELLEPEASIWQHVLPILLVNIEPQESQLSVAQLSAAHLMTVCRFHAHFQYIPCTRQ